MRILYLNKRKDKMSLRGVLISGGAGSGKTSLVLSMVERSCFGAEAPAHTEVDPANEADDLDSALVKLSGQLVGYHFCQVRMILFFFNSYSISFRRTTLPPALYLILSTPSQPSSPRRLNSHLIIGT